MLFLVISQKVTFTVNDRASRDHLGIEQRLTGQQTMEVATMTIRPIEHGCDGKSVSGVFTDIVRLHKVLLKNLAIV